MDIELEEDDDMEPVAKDEAVAGKEEKDFLQEESDKMDIDNEADIKDVSQVADNAGNKEDDMMETADQVEDQEEVKKEQKQSYLNAFKTKKNT